MAVEMDRVIRSRMDPRRFSCLDKKCLKLMYKVSSESPPAGRACLCVANLDPLYKF
jgi:hypothetical protein